MDAPDTEPAIVAAAAAWALSLFCSCRRRILSLVVGMHVCQNVCEYIYISVMYLYVYVRVGIRTPLILTSH